MRYVHLEKSFKEFKNKNRNKVLAQSHKYMNTNTNTNTNISTTDKFTKALSELSTKLELTQKQLEKSQQKYSKVKTVRHKLSKLHARGDKSKIYTGTKEQTS